MITSSILPILACQVWKAWMFYRTTAASSHGRLRNGMDQWREWLRVWNIRVRALGSIIDRRAVASALHHWRLLSSGANDRRTLLQAVVGRQLEVMLLRKSFLALTQNGLAATTLRRLIASFRTRTLRGGFEAWRQAQLPPEKQKKSLPPPPLPSPDAAVTVITTGRRRQPGNPRKHHCRCVYAVSRGQRCTCAPRSHLLRRVEELHRLVAQGLDGRQGGYRLLSHVVQRDAPAPRSGGARLGGGGRNPPSSLGISGRGRDEPQGTPRAVTGAGEGRGKNPKERMRPGFSNFCKRGREQGLPVAAAAAAGGRSAVSSAAATAAAAITSCHVTEADFVRLGARRTHSLDEKVDAIDDCVALAASDRLRCDPAVRPQAPLLLQT